MVIASDIQMVITSGFNQTNPKELGPRSKLFYPYEIMVIFEGKKSPL